MRRTILRLLSSFRSSRAERELAREIRSHLQSCSRISTSRGAWTRRRRATPPGGHSAASSR
jgi:hypothetical protein